MPKSEKFKLNSPIYPERIQLSHMHYSDLLEGHRELQKEIGHKLLDLGFPLVIFDYPIILEKKLRSYRGKTSHVWVVKKVADVLGFKKLVRKINGSPSYVGYQVYWVECGGTESINRLMADPEILEFLQFLKSHGFRFTIFYYDRKHTLTAFWGTIEEG